MQAWLNIKIFISFILREVHHIKRRKECNHIIIISIHAEKANKQIQQFQDTKSTYKYQLCFYDSNEDCKKITKVTTFNIA